jgi:hypothetical protein
VCARALTLGAAARKLGVRRLGGQDLDFEAAPVDLDGVEALA